MGLFLGGGVDVGGRGEGKSHQIDYTQGAQNHPAIMVDPKQISTTYNNMHL